MVLVALRQLFGGSRSPANHAGPGLAGAQSDGVRYQFRIQDEPQTVIFRFKPERGGSLSGSLRVNDGPPTAFRQWLFP